MWKLPILQRLKKRSSCKKLKRPKGIVFPLLNPFLQIVCYETFNVFLVFMPTGLAMLLFIAFPLVSVVLQSVHTLHEAVLVTVENCGPFGCKQETTIDQDATRA